LYQIFEVEHTPGISKGRTIRCWGGPIGILIPRVPSNIFARKIRQLHTISYADPAFTIRLLVKTLSTQAYSWGLLYCNRQVGMIDSKFILVFLVIIIFCLIFSYIL